MHRLPVSQIMTTAVVTIHPGKLVADAAQMMEDLYLRRLPVVDEDAALVGIITDSDVLQAEAAGSAAANPYLAESAEKWLTVSDVMTRDVVTIGVDATVGELATLLIDRKVGGVPVVIGDPLYPKRIQVVGMVTATDVLRMIADAWAAFRVGATQRREFIE